MKITAPRDTFTDCCCCYEERDNNINSFNILIIVVIFVMWSFQLNKDKSKNEVLLVT